LVEISAFYELFELGMLYWNTSSCELFLGSGWT
jgi:hypothetical protein